MRRTDVALGALVVLFLGATAGIVVADQFYDFAPDMRLPWACLPVLVVALAAAEVFQIDVRGGSYKVRFTLITSVIAPVLYGYGVPGTVAAVAVAQLVALRGGAILTGLLSLGRWTLSAACGAVAAGVLEVEPVLTVRSVAALTGALAVVVLVNLTCVALTRAVATVPSWPYTLPGWRYLWFSALIHWVANTLFGLLFVFAIEGSPLAVVLVPVPLLLLWGTARAYTVAYADQQRVEVLSEAGRVLSDPVDTATAIGPFLGEIRRRFEARAAEVVVRQEDGRAISHVDQRDVPYAGPEPSGPIDRRLLRSGRVQRARVTDNSALARLMAEQGWSGLLSAPMEVDGVVIGHVTLFDLAPSDATEQSQLAVLETLARQTAHTLARGWAIAKVVENERALADILRSTSDGIATMAATGEVTTWNPACERITGLSAAEVLGTRDLQQRLVARTSNGARIDLSIWGRTYPFPRELIITRADGVDRRLSITATRGEAPAGSPQLVVIARDITPASEYHELRSQFAQLLEVQAAQRLVVDHLQQAVAPEPPGVSGLDIAVAYVASDAASPTGGDLFDWHVLPDGSLHVAVVDVLGHGVTATRDALTVIHTLRFVAVEGTPLERLIERADELLGAQESELVATAVVVRVDPATGDLRVATGGHPPPLVVGPGGRLRQVAGRGGAIGWPGVGSIEVAHTRLAPEESLILYTDGLVEAGKDIVAGMDELGRIAAEAADASVKELSDALVERSLEGAARRDDALALVLRRERVTVSAGRSRWVLPADAEHELRRVRSELGGFLRDHGYDSGDPVTVAAELLANALRAARTEVALTVELAEVAVVVDVLDDGPGDALLPTRGYVLPVAGSEGGRGLYMVRSLSDDVRIRSGPDGSRIRATVCVTPLTPRPRAAHAADAGSHRP
ncbi:ATP-binding SpoIIE family protein phosphatase [Mumia flava]|nr:SpoIIE family protein phosphatase [Mumia flava]